MHNCFKNLMGILLAACLFTLPAPSAADNYPEVMIILDGSGSMWAQLEGEPRIDTAKKVLQEIVPSLPAEVRIGLTAYGHRLKGRCDDIEVLIPAGSNDRDMLLEKVMAISPKGKTPIAESVRLVVNELKQKETETTIILVSDGLETCHPDPCALVRELRETGIKFILHVVGFAVTEEENKQLSCLAEAGGGSYYTAGSASELLNAFQSMQQELVQKVEYEKATTTRKKARSGLGKLRLIFPDPGEKRKGLEQFRIVRKSDGKTIKTVERPDSDSSHPLPAGEYQVVLGYANTNFQPPSEISPLNVTVEGGETSELALGMLIFNVAESLKKLPADFVTLRTTDGKFVVHTPSRGNSAHFFTAKPLPPGSYSFEYGNDKIEPKLAIVASGLEIKPRAETVLTLDSGFQIKKHDQSMTGFDIVGMDEKTVLQVRRRWDNTYPHWETFPLAPGAYAVLVYLKGMNEPLPVGELEIRKGEIVEFDTGL
ncbi:MAG: VWA domain-containing protein [Deltaproteobacteria bacterium]|nr:VWA domain-containing protein [Deltaproteobacteria bacterium]